MILPKKYSENQKVSVFIVNPLMHMLAKQKPTFYDETGATHPTLTNETFSYDKVGNRLSTQASATPWTYNNADQLLTTPEATYLYNANGHTKSVDYTDTALPDMAYSYDARERLKRVLKTDDGSQIQSNRYDYNNRRLVKTTASGSVYFLYSVYGLEAEFNAGGDLIQGYLFGSNIYSTSPILTYKLNSSNGLDYHYYHNDHLFTPQRLTDNTGTLSWSADYSAFGETTITKEIITNNLRFPGQYYDVDIKLAQNYFRDYSAKLGRYMQSDFIGIRGGINIYGYAFNNTNLYIDPEGRFFFVGGIIGGIAGGINALINDEDFFWGAVKGAASGVIGAGIGSLGGILAGGIGGFIAGGINSFLNGDDASNILGNAIAGGIGGLIGGGFGSFAREGAEQFFVSAGTGLGFTAGGTFVNHFFRKELEQCIEIF